MPASSTPIPDILIAGGGIIGLSLALELHHRGARVNVLERDTALAHASSAAAGMLAAEDPHNTPALFPLSRLSLQLYPAFLARIAALSGTLVPFQTHTTIQYLPDGSTTQLAEHSLDPRQLAGALLAAVRATSIDLREHTALKYTEEWPQGITPITTTGERVPQPLVVNTAGAWAPSIKFHSPAPPITPVKGQMLRLKLPANLRLQQVHRSEHVYIVPRLHGPQAGSALIGSTLEHAGFDTTTHPADLTRLRRLAAGILPQLADESTAPMLESWAGLRPGTPDHLPIFTTYPAAREILATGHYRNGILLAPATAFVIANLIERKPSPIDLAPFSVDRFPQSRAIRGLPK
jgi:glycine oxidase